MDALFQSHTGRPGAPQVGEVPAEQSRQPGGRMREAAKHVGVMGSGCCMWLGTKDHDARSLCYSLMELASWKSDTNAEEIGGSEVHLRL